MKECQRRKFFTMGVVTTHVTHITCSLKPFKGCWHELCPLHMQVQTHERHLHTHLPTSPPHHQDDSCMPPSHAPAKHPPSSVTQGTFHAYRYTPSNLLQINRTQQENTQERLSHVGRPSSSSLSGPTRWRKTAWGAGLGFTKENPARRFIPAHQGMNCLCTLPKARRRNYGVCWSLEERPKRQADDLAIVRSPRIR